MDFSNPLHLTVLIGQILAVAGAFSLLVSLIFLIAGLIGWKSPRRKRRLTFSAIGLGAYVTLGVANYAWIHAVMLPWMGRESLEKRDALYAEASVVHPGDTAPLFVITDTDGREISLEELRGRVVAVNFFATWCGSCLNELPHLQTLYNDYRHDDRFALVVVGREESEDTVRSFQQKHGYTFPIAADPNLSVYDLYAKEMIPRTYLISADGRIAFVLTGFDGEEAIDRLRAEINTELQKTSLPLPAA